MAMNAMAKNTIPDAETQVSLKKEREREKEFMRINEGNECITFRSSNLIRAKFPPRSQGTTLPHVTAFYSGNLSKFLEIVCKKCNYILSKFEKLSFEIFSLNWTTYYTTADMKFNYGYHALINWIKTGVGSGKHVVFEPTKNTLCNWYLLLTTKFP